MNALPLTETCFYQLLWNSPTVGLHLERIVFTHTVHVNEEESLRV